MQAGKVHMESEKKDRDRERDRAAFHKTFGGQTSPKVCDKVTNLGVKFHPQTFSEMQPCPYSAPDKEQISGEHLSICSRDGRLKTTETGGLHGQPETETLDQ